MKSDEAAKATPEANTAENAPEASMGVVPFAAIAGSVVALDQITKWLVLENIPLYQANPVIPGFFNLTHIRNPGGAFGFMAAGSQGLRHLLFIGVSIIAMGLIAYFYRSTPKSYPYLGTALALIFGGAVGNLIDRLRFGEVVDFLDVYVGAYHWPAFNVADSAITVGITIFILHVVLGKMPE
jgi:signal peptidase II